MKILEKSVMKNGVKIQLEDWDGNLTIGAYPTAKANNWIIKYGKPFRLTISASKYNGYSNDNVKADFEALKNGEKILEDLADYFWNGKEDCIFLGIV